MQHTADFDAPHERAAAASDDHQSDPLAIHYETSQAHFLAQVTSLWSQWFRPEGEPTITPVDADDLPASDRSR